MNILRKLFSQKVSGGVKQSAGGSVIHRHKKPIAPTYDSPGGDEETITLVDHHITKYLGSPSSVFHEIVSPYAHVDIHLVSPTKEHNFNILVTSGMSYKPMNVPKGFEKYSYGELMLCLPPDWDLSQKGFEDENNYWPLRWLKILGSFPHMYNTWLSRGHTLPNQDSEPFASKTNLTTMYLSFPILVPREFIKLQVNSEKTIWFYSVIPLYTSESNFKLNKGADALEDLFDSNNMSELLDPVRKQLI